MSPETWRRVGFAHRGELLRTRAGIWNFAWATGANYLISRTSGGLLSTTFNKKGEIKHTWYDQPQRGFSPDFEGLLEIAA